MVSYAGGSDYDALNKTIIFNASNGTVVNCVDINIIDDMLVEPNAEDFSIALSGPIVNQLAIQPNRTVLILDNDISELFMSHVSCAIVPCYYIPPSNISPLAYWKGFPVYAQALFI